MKKFLALLFLFCVICLAQKGRPQQFGTYNLCPDAPSANDGLLWSAAFNCWKPTTTVNKPPCSASVSTNCVPTADASGNVAIADTVLLKANGGSSLYLWPGTTEPSALAADANTFGPAGAKVSGDTMSYADLIALWDTFTGAGNFTGWSVTKTTIGADESGTKTLYYYSFTDNQGGNSRYDRTVFIMTGQQPTEWAPPLALWRFFWHVQQGHVSLPRFSRYIVVPCGNPWAWDQSPRVAVNVNGVALNRNYPWRWGASAAADKGASSLSEDEASRINTVINAAATKPTVLLDLHNQSADTCDVQGFLPDSTLQQFFDPIERVIAYRATSTPNTACIWGNFAEPALINAAANLGAVTFAWEGHGGTAGEPYASAAWMTRAVQTIGNVILSYSQPDVSSSRAGWSATTKATVNTGTTMVQRGTTEATWDFMDAAGATATDIYSTGSDGTLSGVAPPTWRTLGGITFTGTGYVTLGKAAIGANGLFADATHPFTVAVVFKTAATNAGVMLSRCSGNAATCTFKLNFIANSPPQVNIRGTVTNAAVNNDGGWHMHSVRWDGASAYYRLDNGNDIPLGVGAAAVEAGENILIGARTTATPAIFLPAGTEMRWGTVRDVSLTSDELTGLYQYLRLTLASSRVLLP